MIKRKLIILACIVFSIFLLLLIPKDQIKNIPQKVSYTNELINEETIFLIDNNNYVAKTTIGIGSKEIEDKAKELIEILIIDGKYESKIPSGFKSVISEETVINKVEYNENTLKLDFNSHLLDKEEEKVIESLTYTLTSLEGVNNILVYIEGELLTKYPNSKKLLSMPLDKTLGINKVYDINELKDITSVTIYYLNEHDNNFYYVPVTKYMNDTREKITIIIDELNSTSLYTTNLMSFLNQDAKLISMLEKDETLELNFNEAIFNADNIILEEVIYTILYSIEDNYSVKNVTFLVENKEILKKVLKS